MWLSKALFFFKKSTIYYTGLVDRPSKALLDLSRSQAILMMSVLSCLESINPFYTFQQDI